MNNRRATLARLPLPHGSRPRARRGGEPARIPRDGAGATPTRRRSPLASLVPILLLCSSAFGAVVHADDAAEREVGQLIERYFDVWSAGDMDAYERTFHPDAVVYFLTPSGGARRFDVTPFVDTQRRVKDNESTPSTEIPLEVEITTEGDVAHARVLWELTKGDRVTTGLDYFALVRSEGDWRILSLMFLNL